MTPWSSPTCSSRSGVKKLASGNRLRTSPRGAFGENVAMRAVSRLVDRCFSSSYNAVGLKASLSLVELDLGDRRSARGEGLVDLENVDFHTADPSAAVNGVGVLFGVILQGHVRDLAVGEDDVKQLRSVRRLVVVRPAVMDDELVNGNRLAEADTKDWLVVRRLGNPEGVRESVDSALTRVASNFTGRGRRGGVDLEVLRFDLLRDRVLHGSDPLIDGVSEPARDAVDEAENHSNNGGQPHDGSNHFGERQALSSPLAASGIGRAAPRAFARSKFLAPAVRDESLPPL